MKLKYYLRGMGIGMIITAIVMGIALNGRKETLTDAEIMARARELGMIDSTVLSDYAAQGAMGDALGGAGDQGNAADGSAGVSVKSVTQSGEAASHRVVFEKIDPVEQKPSTDAGTGALKTDKADEASSTEKADAATADTTVKKADAATADTTVKKADAATADTTVKKADAATADTTVKKADAATADTTVKKADAATADTAKKADAASADTAKKADATTADTAKKAGAATADTARKADATAADTAKKPETTVAADAADSGNTSKPALTGEVKTVVIPGGVGSETVARILADAGLVDSAASYDKYLCDNRVDRIIRSGTMSIPEGASWEQIKDIITR